jgi:hypothetical protein
MTEERLRTKKQKQTHLLVSGGETMSVSPATARTASGFNFNDNLF